MSDLADEVGTEEHDILEFKRDLSNVDAVRKAICALANDLPGEGGGLLVVGVEKDGTPRGIAVGDEELLRVANMRDEARILPRPVLRVRAATFAVPR